MSEYENILDGELYCKVDSYIEDDKYYESLSVVSI